MEYILIHTQYNLPRNNVQSKEQYFNLPFQSFKEIPGDVENLYLCEYGKYAGLKFFNISHQFPNLRSLTIGCECFKKVREFILDGLEYLKMVKIAYNCFSPSYEEERDGESDSDDEYKGSKCRIANCPNLNSLEIHDECFNRFYHLELRNVNSLQSINIGSDCFTNADFSLISKTRRIKLIFRSSFTGRDCFG